MEDITTMLTLSIIGLALVVVIQVSMAIMFLRLDALKDNLSKWCEKLDVFRDRLWGCAQRDELRHTNEQIIRLENEVNNLKVQLAQERCQSSSRDWER